MFSGVSFQSAMKFAPTEKNFRELVKIFFFAGVKKCVTILNRKKEKKVEFSPHPSSIARSGNVEGFFLPHWIFIRPLKKTFFLSFLNQSIIVSFRKRRQIANIHFTPPRINEPTSIH